ncbi:MAG: tetratricopeptide repeat protein [Maribacter sp.]|uniref:tetratricopeptide repeat protein n=1 Tax=Maribacter sp. TaxID=1897614 RepID=UPI003C753953
MDKEELLYKFFSNQLTEEQKKTFHQLLETDVEFKAQFEFENDLKRVIKKNQNENLKHKLIGFEKEINAKDKNNPSKWTFSNWSIAASIALLVGLGWLGYNLMSGPNYSKLYAANFQEYPNTVYTITRGEGEETKEREAFVAYESGDYDTALQNFAQISVDNKEYLDFYRAQSHLNLNELEDAKKDFQKVIAADTNFVGESYWYLALIYLKEKDKENAVGSLQILTTKYEYNKGKAEALLKELD